jgi:hypothetical protein
VLPAAGAGSGRLPVALISAASASAAGPGVRVTGAPRARVAGPGVTGQRESGPQGRPGRPAAAARGHCGALASKSLPAPGRIARRRPGQGGQQQNPGEVQVPSPRPLLTSTFIFEGPQRRTGQPDVPGPLAHGHWQGLSHQRSHVTVTVLSLPFSGGQSACSVVRDTDPQCQWVTIAVVHRARARPSTLITSTWTRPNLCQCHITRAFISEHELD